MSDSVRLYDYSKPELHYRHPINGSHVTRPAAVDYQLIEKLLLEINVPLETYYNAFRFNFYYPDENRQYYVNELQSFISYSMFESMMFDFFPESQQQTMKYYTQEVSHVLGMLEKDSAFNEDELAKLFEKYVPGAGTAKTIGGEYIRGLNAFLYHMRNDGDNPVCYAARSKSFWALANCYQIIIEHYRLYIESLPVERVNHDRIGGRPLKLYIGMELDPTTIVDMCNFAKYFVETEEGKKANIIKAESWNENDKPVYDIINPLYESITRYDRYVPDTDRYTITIVDGKFTCIEEMW